MRVLYISYDGLTSHLGRSQILPYVLELSKNYGIKFHLLSAEKKSDLEPGRSGVEQEIKGLPISWSYVLYTKKPPVLSTLYDLVKMYRKAKAITLKEKIEIVHCRSYVPSLIGIRLKKQFSVRFVFDMRGFWADERIEGNIWNPNHVLYRAIYQYFKRWEKKFFKDSDAIVSLTHHGKRYIEEHFEHSPVFVIPCCVDNACFNPNLISSSQQAELKQRLGISSNDKVLVYSGSVGTWYLVDEMLLFFETIKKLDRSWKFLLLTNQNITGRALPDGLITAQARKEEMPLYLSIADLAILFIKHSFSKIASSPIKLGEYLAMGLPVVANNFNEDIQSILQQYQCGVLLDNLSAENITRNYQAIENLLKLDKHNMYRAASEFFGLENGVRTYYSVYKFLGEKSVGR